MIGALSMIVEKNIQRYQEKISKNAFDFYRTYLRKKSDIPSQTQMNTLGSLIQDAGDLNTLLSEVKKFLIKQRDKNQDKKTGWALECEGQMLADIIIEKIGSVDREKFFGDYTFAINSNTSFLKEGLNNEEKTEANSETFELAKLKYIKALFSAILLIYRIENAKLDINGKVKKLSFDLEGGELICRKSQ